MRVTTVNPIAAYSFLLLSLVLPLILYQKLSKQREKLKYASYKTKLLNSPSSSPKICPNNEDLAITDFTKNLDYHFLSNFVQVQQNSNNNSSNSFEKEKDYSQDGQSKLIDDYLKQKECGIFVEIGAADGKVFSNSLFFEVSRNWQGVLIEPNEESFKVLVERNRTRSIAMKACVGPVTADGVHADINS